MRDIAAAVRADNCRLHLEGEAAEIVATVVRSAGHVSPDAAADAPVLPPPEGRLVRASVRRRVVRAEAVADSPVLVTGLAVKSALSTPAAPAYRLELRLAGRLLEDRAVVPLLELQAAGVLVATVLSQSEALDKLADSASDFHASFQEQWGYPPEAPRLFWPSGAEVRTSPRPTALTFAPGDVIQDGALAAEVMVRPAA